MLPSPDILNEFKEGKFVLSNLAAKRARQLAEGAIPLVDVQSTHPLTIALAEIAAGKIRAIMPEIDGVVLEDTTSVHLLDETVPSELGLLLPALDESEAQMVSGATLVAEDEIEELDSEGASLADLLGDDTEEVVVESEEDTLSLTDIADEENAAEEESED